MRTKKQFDVWLVKHEACDAAVQWIGDRTAQQTWDECPRGDWLLWWCQKQKLPLPLLTLAKGKCAEIVIHLMKDQRSKNAVAAAIAFGEGKISREELDSARDAAYAAAYAAADAAADAAAYAAAYAADAAADAAAYAAAYAAADAAAYAAAYAAADAAAYAAAYAAADAAAYAALWSERVALRKAAREANQLLTANIVREIIKPTWL